MKIEKRFFKVCFFALLFKSKFTYPLDMECGVIGGLITPASS